MLKGLTKDLTGAADICTIVKDLTKVQALSYLLPNEQVLFAFAAPQEEFVFTNEALLTLHGESAATTRKLVERLDYRDHLITDVEFETTGRLDRDCEIKFRMGTKHFSIDVARKEEAQVKAYYKVLLVLAREQEQRIRQWEQVKEGLAHTAKSRKVIKNPSTSGSGNGLLLDQASEIAAWLEANFQRLNARCYREVIVDALAHAIQ